MYGDDDRIITAPPVTVEGYFDTSNRESRAAKTTAASDSSSNPALGLKLNPNAAAMSEKVIPAYEKVKIPQFWLQFGAATQSTTYMLHS